MVRKVQNPWVKKAKLWKKKTIKFVSHYRIAIVLNIVFVVLVVAVGLNLSHTEEQAHVELPIPPQVEALTANASSTPVRFSIPTIGVDTNVQLVGITKSGNMGVPDNFTDVGWYRLGFAPGILGNSVIAGHLDNAKGTPGVFENLSKLHIGDEVYVLNKAGEKLQFKVIGLALYGYNDTAPLQMIFGSSTEAHLNIITCDGVWDKVKKVYDKRLVVFTRFSGTVSDSGVFIPKTSIDATSTATSTKIANTATSTATSTKKVLKRRP